MAYYPNLRHEKKLSKKGYQHIVGLDEAGRGSWAGPIVAGAVILDLNKKIKGLKDSKKLRMPDRKQLFVDITNQALAWAIGAISQTNIDRIGIARANALVMQLALKNLAIQPDFVLIDAIPINYHAAPTQTVIGGDHKISSIAAASIIAKVTRDQIMDELAEKYPAYGFNHHKGYGTNHHFQMLMEHGISKIHRKSFQPMKDLIRGSKI